MRTSNGAVKIVAAKFGTSSLTGAQWALRERTTTAEVANAAGRGAAVAAATTSAVVGEIRNQAEVATSEQFR